MIPPFPKETHTMPSPADLKFTDSHEWFRVEGDVVTVGITQFAANELTDVTFVQMKGPGTAVAKGTSLGEVESVKTTSDVYSALSGTITEVNPAVSSDASLVNSDPFGRGWLVKLKATDLTALAGLMNAAAYDAKHPVQ